MVIAMAFLLYDDIPHRCRLCGLYSLVVTSKPLLKLCNRYDQRIGPQFSAMILDLILRLSGSDKFLIYTPPCHNGSVLCCAHYRAKVYLYSKRDGYIRRK